MSCMLTSLNKRIKRRGMYYRLITLLMLSSVQGQADLHNESCNGTKPIKLPPPCYNKIRPPQQNGKPVKARMILWLESVIKVDVTVMEFEVHGYVIQKWNDYRLKNISDESIILKEDTDVWVPDGYCTNCRSSSLGRLMVKIQPNGDMYYSQGARMAASCAMDLHNFPFDRQECEIKFSSYSSNTSLLQYTWDEGSNGAVVVASKELDQFVIEGTSIFQTEKTYASGNFTIIGSTFIFVRRIGFYIIQVFLPTSLVVCLSWIVFYMDMTVIGDRLAIAVTLMMTMIFLMGYINTSLPKVSYAKAVDIYLIVSLIMIIATVAEVMLTYGLCYASERTKEKSEDILKLIKANEGFDDTITTEQSGIDRNKKKQSQVTDHKPKRQRSFLQKHSGAMRKRAFVKVTLDEADTRKLEYVVTLAKKCRLERQSNAIFTLSKTVNYVARVIFPVAFLIFNIAYFHHFSAEV